MRAVGFVNVDGRIDLAVNTDLAGCFLIAHQRRLRERRRMLESKRDECDGFIAFVVATIARTSSLSRLSHWYAFRQQDARA